MPFVKRDNAGQIISVHAGADDENCHEVAADDPELSAFVAANSVEASADGNFERLDQDFIRVIEDVIYMLIDKQLIVLTDLPVAAQRKLAERRNLRGTSGDLGSIVSTTDELLIP